MKKTGTILLLSAGLVFSSVPAMAGFGYDKDDQPITITNDPNSPSWTPAQDSKPATGATRPVSDPGAPALQTFEERYIPDSVRKKYAIQDDWYEIGNPEGLARASEVPYDPNGATEPSAVPPQSLAPADMELPPEEQSALEPAAAPATAPVATPVAAPVTAAPANYVKVDSWRARKGEPVRAIIKRWSRREGTEMLWAAGTEPVLQRDFSYFGTMEDAIAAIVRETGGNLFTQYRADGLNPMAAAPAPAPATPAATATEAEFQGVAYDPSQPVVKGRETRWFALPGSSLREVLQVWAEDAGASLVWQAPSNYALKDSVSQVGRFEDAVFRLLSQYDGDGNRPVGQLYSDPASGQKVLLIKTETPS